MRRVGGSPFDAFASLRGESAIGDSLRYEDQMRSTPAGRRSVDLRARAHDLKRIGLDGHAHELLVRAAAEHEADDEGAAAAACWHDLGMSTKDLRTGVRSQNLLEAERLLRRAVASPGRRQDVRRHILSLDGLGQVLRAIAQELPLHGVSNADALDCLRKAVALAREHGLETIDWLTNALSNFGNALKSEGRIDEAIRAHEESVRIAEWIAREVPQIEELMSNGLDIARLRLNLVFALSARGRRTDLIRALELVDGIITGQSVLSSRAGIAGYEIARRIKGARAERARSYLKRVEPAHLRAGELRQFLEALVAEGELERALTLAQRSVAEALQSRRIAISDPAADEVAVEAQFLARRSAELLVQNGRSVEAFLALESAGGLRYMEVVTHYSWVPRNPAVRALTLAHGQAGNMAVLLDDLAARIAGIDPGEHGWLLGQLFAEVLKAIQVFEGREPAWDGSSAEIATVLERARTNCTPGDVLREHSRTLSSRAVALEMQIAKLDPERSKAIAAWSETSTEASLQGIFSEHPEVVLLRLAVDQDDLLAIAVWRSGETTTGAAATFQVPDGILDAVRALSDGSPAPQSEEVQRAQTAVESFLTTVDLGRVLPGRVEHVVVIPSLSASLIPWASCGPPGGTFLDLADAISYLPNITPLLMRQAATTARSGTLLVSPGAAPSSEPTHFHALAFAEPSAAETRLSEDAATKDAVRAQVASADVVSFFAHGRYSEETPDGAIRLADGDLTPGEYGEAWQGMERVELWACRSGVNLSYDPLTPWVDEAFGLDVQLHQLGVRSTIGTFWNVPDYVTALLVREYRRALARGRTAPAALADAMRWWRDEGIAQAQLLLESDAPVEKLRELATSLGAVDEGFDAIVGATLGPVPTKGRLAPTTVAKIIRAWSSPTAWAGIRFLGVCERRPLGAAPGVI